MTFAGFWYSAARKVPAHPGRVGGVIVPRAIVVHTTDCMPGSFNGIVQRWSTEAGEQCAAHFIIGRSEIDGVVQFAPINKNANHAGGSRKVNGKLMPFHGNFVVGGVVIHPNTMTVGIELDCAGYLGRRKAGVDSYIHADSGSPVPAYDVQVDARGIGWHRVTDYQYAQLDLLLRDLESVLLPLSVDTTIAPNGAYAGNGVPWAAMPTARVVGHVTLDPNNKTDPGPFVLDWMRKR